MLPGALNSLVNTRLVTCFLTRIALLVISSVFLFQLDCYCYGYDIVFMDGLCKVQVSCEPEPENVLIIVAIGLFWLNLNLNFVRPE